MRACVQSFVCVCLVGPSPLTHQRATGASRGLDDERVFPHCAGAGAIDLGNGACYCVLAVCAIAIHSYAQVSTPSIPCPAHHRRGARRLRRTADALLPRCDQGGLRAHEARLRMYALALRWLCLVPAHARSMIAEQTPHTPHTSHIPAPLIQHSAGGRPCRPPTRTRWCSCTRASCGCAARGEGIARPLKGSWSTRSASWTYVHACVRACVVFVLCCWRLPPESRPIASGYVTNADPLPNTHPRTYAGECGPPRRPLRPAHHPLGEFVICGGGRTVCVVVIVEERQNEEIARAMPIPTAASPLESTHTHTHARAAGGGGGGGGAARDGGVGGAERKSSDELPGHAGTFERECVCVCRCVCACNTQHGKPLPRSKPHRSSSLIPLPLCE